MLPFLLIALQAAPPSTATPPAKPPPAPPVTTAPAKPPPAPPVTTAPGAPPPAPPVTTAPGAPPPAQPAYQDPYRYRYPYGYPQRQPGSYPYRQPGQHRRPYPQRPPAGAAPYPPPRQQKPAPPKPPEPERTVVHGLGRLELGLGTHGFSANTSLLSDVGYGGVKFWATVDGAYMFHEHFGAGIWMGLNKRTASPDRGPALDEMAFFIGAQAPILIFGSRLFALHVVPRVGFASGQIELDYANSVDAEYQNAVIWGGGITATTFKYHLGTTMGLLRAVVDPPGEAGRDHDFGGLYWTLGGTFDG